MPIRKVELKDLPEISKIYENGVSPIDANFEEKVLLVDNYRRLLNCSAENCNMYVLDEGSIKGFILYEKEGCDFLLQDIFVVEKGKGYGRKLIEHMLNEAKKLGIKRIHLEVRDDNKDAQEFFKKMGFIQKSIGMSLILD